MSGEQALKPKNFDCNNTDYLRNFAIRFISFHSIRWLLLLLVFFLLLLILLLLFVIRLSCSWIVVCVFLGDVNTFLVCALFFHCSDHCVWKIYVTSSCVRSGWYSIQHLTYTQWKCNTNNLFIPEVAWFFRFFSFYLCGDVNGPFSLGRFFLLLVAFFTCLATTKRLKLKWFGNSAWNTYNAKACVRMEMHIQALSYIHCTNKLRKKKKEPEERNGDSKSLLNRKRTIENNSKVRKIPIDCLWYVSFQRLPPECQTIRI